MSGILYGYSNCLDAKSRMLFVEDRKLKNTHAFTGDAHPFAGISVVILAVQGFPVFSNEIVLRFSVSQIYLSGYSQNNELTPPRFGLMRGARVTLVLS